MRLHCDSGVPCTRFTGPDIVKATLPDIAGSRCEPPPQVSLVQPLTKIHPTVSALRGTHAQAF